MPKISVSKCVQNMSLKSNVKYDIVFKVCFYFFLIELKKSININAIKI